MSAFERSQRRFLCSGVQLTRAADNCDPGKFPFLLNARSVIQGTIQARDGLVAVAGLGSVIRTVARFDDSSPFAANPNLYVIGASTNLYIGPPAGPFPQVDTGYSGNPMSLVEATPPQSPQPYLYIADTSRMRKVNANGGVYQVGISPPTAEPSATLQQLGSNVVENFTIGFVPWVPIPAGEPTIVQFNGPVFRVNTSIASILYDSGSAPGYASIVPVLTAGIDEGALLSIGTGGETIAVTETTLPVATTTIQAILYDTGGSGLCTIQPAASLGTGRITAPSINDVRTRFNIPYAVPRGTEASGPGLPAAPIASGLVSRQIDFPVNALVTLGSELVRILSVAVGPDGVQSFRCSTSSTHAAGESIVGSFAFRAFVVGSYGPAAALQDSALDISIFPITPNPPVANAVPQVTGGMRTGGGWAPRNLALINGRATLPDDDLRLSIRALDYTGLQTVRVYLSMEPTAGSAPSTADFTANYYFFEWRQSDIAAAIQNINGDTTATVQAVRQTVQANAQLNTLGQVLDIFANTGLGAISGAEQIPQIQTSTGQYIRLPEPQASQFGADATAMSQALALGNNQWIELKCKIGQLIRIGTDPSTSLSTITAAEILVNVVNNPNQIDFDALWISGGYGPESGIGASYVYTHRYRSSLTGAVSNPCPPTRGGVIPMRQAVSVTGQHSADPQVDLVDWFKLGGALTNWTYTGTTPNGTPPTFLDVYEDTALAGGETLQYDNFPPFPTQDLPRSGTCNVAGSAIQWVSGATFNVNWQPGSIILVNEQAYTLYSVRSSTFLFINENAGSGSAVPFTLTGPTLIGQNFGSVWGGPIAGSVYLFACQNPIDPGMVSWTQGNNPEQASDKSTLQVTTAADPLQAGFMWDGISMVSSTQDVYALEPTQDPVAPFKPIVTPCGRGFWTPWAWCVAPEGIYFLAKDGIFLTTGGSGAISITDADLYPLFPHEGVVGQTVNGYLPVDMTLAIALRLAYVDGWVIFDYKDTNNAYQTLCYRTADKSWWPDTTTPGASVHESAVGVAIHNALIGGNDGWLYTQGGSSDNGVNINCLLGVVDNQGDARRFKLYRDVFIKGLIGSGNGVVTVGVTDNTTTLPPSTISGASLADYVIDTVPQTGIYGTNILVQIAWVPTSTTAPIWEVLDLAFQNQPELASSWLSGPTTFGFRGYMQIQRALIAYLSNGPVTLSVIVDGVLYTYALPSTAGQYAKQEVILQSVKGLTFQLGMQGSPFLLFDKDCEFWTQQWGASGGYQQVRPF